MGGRLDGGEPGIGRRDLLHLVQCMPSAAIDFTVISRTKFPPVFQRYRLGSRSIRVSSDAVKPVVRKTLRLKIHCLIRGLCLASRQGSHEGQKKG